MSIYPRKWAVATAAGDHLKDLDWDPMVDAANGMNIAGGVTIQYPYSFIVRNVGGVYDAISGNGVLTYGGSSDAGTIDGGDFDAVWAATLTALGDSGKIHVRKGIYPTDGLNIANTAAVTDADQQEIEIEGEGMFNTIFRLNTDSAGASSTDGAFTEKASLMIDSVDASGIRVHLHDFQIDGVHDSNANIVSGIVARYPRNALMERLFIQRCSKNGINLVGPNASYRETTIHNNIIYDINDPDGVPGVDRLVNCCGINTTAAFADAYIYNNVIGWIGYVDDVTPWLGTCIGLNDSNIANNNVMWTCAIGIETYADAKDQMIMNNWIDYAYTTAVLLTSNIQATCNDNIIRHPYTYGIYLNNTTKSEIHNNKLIMRPTFTLANHFITEAGTSDENSIIGNNCFHNGTVTGNTIFPIGPLSVVQGNPGFNPKSTVSNFFDTTNDRIVIEGGDATTPAASTDYIVCHSDIFINSTNSGNTNCAIQVKTPGGANMLPVAVSTLSGVIVPRLHKINWGAYTGAAPSVIISWL
jgi:hypothetical protein